MLTRITGAEAPVAAADKHWLDLSAATVEVTSEAADHSIESALTLGASDSAGWRAASPGEQIIRVVLNAPRQITRIKLEFRESATTRTQEFALEWADGLTQPLGTIVRQQWNFSPEGATLETEDYKVDLENVRVIQLTINPDIRGGDARASLARLRLA